MAWKECLTGKSRYIWGRNTGVEVRYWIGNNNFSYETWKKKKKTTFSVSGFLHKLNKNKLIVAEGKHEGEGKWGSLGWTCTHCQLKMITTREEHRNMYIIYGETDHQPRLDAWDKCSGLMHWEDPEGLGGEGGGRGDRDGEHM